jgi:hypothetical protein
MAVPTPELGDDGGLDLAAGPPGAPAAAVDVFDPEVTLEPVRVEKTPGRNEPCYCGSGKKFKLCHGR